MRPHTQLGIGLVVVALVVGGAWYLFNPGVNPITEFSTKLTQPRLHRSNRPGTSASDALTASSSAPTNSMGTGYTLADVAVHADGTSCWTSINGGVYDLTSWIAQHPGGQAAILSLCGMDGSAAFNAQHGGQRRPEAELASFKIGILTN